ncbi:MAG: AraC family transcriptional regulator [Gammaproteobacteria bacterium]|jgi:AraC family transcriptional activator of pobA|nr:AraC family transcriptional regulator [Gammaproteobacteria bacterium]
MREPQAAIPRFFLYGEPPRDAGERFLHVETIADRSRVNDWRIQPHAHRDLHQLLVIFTGSGEMEAETRRQPFRAPALLVVPAGVVHGFSFAEDTEGYVVTLADTLLRDLARDERSFTSLFANATCASLDEDPVHFQEFAQEFAQEFKDTLPKLRRELVWSAPASAAAATARLTTLLVSAVRALHQPSEVVSAAGSARAALVARLRERIETDLRSRLSVAQYAKALNVTPARLRAACIEVTGKTPMRVLEERLVLEAKRNLTYTNMTVAQIAYYLGFTDPAYFSRFFSKLAGESPAAFRRRVVNS